MPTTPTTGFISQIDGILYSSDPASPTPVALARIVAMARPVQPVSANYAVLGTDEILLVTTGASDVTSTLPTAVGILGQTYTVVKVDAGAGRAAIASTSAQTFNGAATPYLLLTAQWNFATFMSDNANWVKIG